jgi:hypothetical protein
MGCMTFRTQSESNGPQEHQQKLREEARRRRAIRFRSRFTGSEQMISDDSEYSGKECKEDGIKEEPLFMGKLNVSFANVRIKEYAICLGDNPGGRGGPPISLSWITVHPHELIHSLDDYEKSHDARRRGISLILPPEHRIKVLRDLGFTDIQIKAVTKKTATIRAQRRDTYAALAFGEDWIMAVDSFKHLFRRERNRKVGEADDEETISPSKPWISCTGGMNHS